MDEDNRFKGRRHSIDAVALANMARQARRVSFGGHAELSALQPQNRRHSVMLAPQSTRRVSIDPRTGRRQSRAYSILSNFDSTTFSGLPMMKAEPKQENTYRLGPEEGEKFKAHIVRHETKKVMDDVLEESSYITKGFPKARKFGKGTQSTGKEGGSLAKNLVTEVKDRLKELDMKRYKFVVNAFVGDKRGQGLRIASRSLWSTETDGCVTVEHQNDKHFAVVVVHAVYYA